MRFQVEKSSQSSSRWESLVKCSFVTQQNWHQFVALRTLTCAAPSVCHSNNVTVMCIIQRAGSLKICWWVPPYPTLPYITCGQQDFGDCCSCQRSDGCCQLHSVFTHTRPECLSMTCCTTQHVCWPHLGANENAPQVDVHVPVPIFNANVLHGCTISSSTCSL